MQQQFLFCTESDFEGCGAETSAVACVAATRQQWERAAITPASQSSSTASSGALVDAEIFELGETGFVGCPRKGPGLM